MTSPGVVLGSQRLGGATKSWTPREMESKYREIIYGRFQKVPNALNIVCFGVWGN